MVGSAVIQPPNSPWGVADTLKLTESLPVFLSVMLCVVSALLLKEAPANRMRGSRLLGVMLTVGAVSM